MFDIVYFTNENDNSQVGQFLADLRMGMRTKQEKSSFNKYLAYEDLLKENGIALGEPYLKNMHLGQRHAIYELRPKDIRIYFVISAKNEIVMLYACYKGSQKAEKIDKERAISKYKNWIRLGGE